MQEYLENFLRRENIAYKISEDLSKKSYIGIGVAADIAYPADKSELITLISILKELNIEFKILGAMSNTLICDSAHRYFYISTERMQGVNLENCKLSAMSGVRFSPLIRYACENGYSLLPELFGIPGSVGGMVYSNAGAFGVEISDAFVCAELLDLEAMAVRSFSIDDMYFAYRKSILQSGRYVLISATFLLSLTNGATVKRKIGEIIKRRKDSQPTEYRSLGSIFKRPPNDYAARLIDDAGFRGVRVGDAAVSQKHAGFIVNLGAATANDVTALIEKIKKTVYERYGVSLSEEIEILR